MNWKPLVFASIILIVSVVVGFSVFTGLANTAFNSVLGNSVDALVIDYRPALNGFGGVSFSVTLDLIKTREPLETVLLGYGVQTGTASFNNSLSVTIYVTGTVANNINIYAHTFNFNDVKARVITCYLHDYDSRRYPLLKMNVYGSYMFEGNQFSFGPYEAQNNEA